jgi:hypothetical protein
VPSQVRAFPRPALSGWRRRSSHHDPVRLPCSRPSRADDGRRARGAGAGTGTCTGTCAGASTGARGLVCRDRLQHPASPLEGRLPGPLRAHDAREDHRGAPAGPRVPGGTDPRPDRGPRDGPAPRRPRQARRRAHRRARGFPRDELRVGRRVLRHAPRRRDDGRPRLQGLRVPAPGPRRDARRPLPGAPHPERPPALGPGAARPRRRGLAVRLDDQGLAGRGPREPPADDRQLHRLHRHEGVPAARRDAGPQPPAAEHPLARRPLHGGAGARADGAAHRRAALHRRRGEAGPPVLPPDVQRRAGPLAGCRAWRSTRSSAGPAPTAGPS